MPHAHALAVAALDLDVPPPSGLAGGRWEAPAWLIAALGIVVVVLGVAHFVSRARRARRDTR